MTKLPALTVPDTGYYMFDIQQIPMQHMKRMYDFPTISDKFEA
jgi:hypothetical protein